MSTNEDKISPDDPRLTAYALGELEGAELAEVEAALRADPAAQTVVAQIRVAADQLQAALAGETVEAAAGGADRVPSGQRDGRARSWPRPLLWYGALGGLAAAFLAVLAVRENLRRPAHEPEAIVALSRSNPLAAAKAPAMEVMEAKVEPDGAVANAQGEGTAVGDGLRRKAADQVLAVAETPAKATGENPVVRASDWRGEMPSISDALIAAKPQVAVSGSAFGGKALSSNVDSTSAASFDSARSFKDQAAAADAGRVRILALNVSAKRAAEEEGRRSPLSEAAIAGFASLPRAVALAAAPKVHRYIQDEGIFYRSSPKLMNCDPRILVFTGRFGTAVDKDFEILAVPVPNLSEARTADPPMTEGGTRTRLNDSLSADSDPSGIAAAAREAYRDVWQRIQAEEGTPFEQLATAPDGGRLPGLGDVKLRFSESMPRP